MPKEIDCQETGFRHFGCPNLRSECAAHGMCVGVINEYYQTRKLGSADGVRDRFAQKTGALQGQISQPEEVDQH